MFRYHTRKERPGGQHPSGHREEHSREGGDPEQAHDWGPEPPMGCTQPVSCPKAMRQAG